MPRNNNADRGRRFAWADPSQYGSSGNTMRRPAKTARAAANQGEDFRTGTLAPRRGFFGRRGDR